MPPRGQRNRPTPQPPTREVLEQIISANFDAVVAALSTRGPEAVKAAAAGYRAGTRMHVQGSLTAKAYDKLQELVRGNVEPEGRWEDDGLTKQECLDLATLLGLSAADVGVEDDGDDGDDE